MSEHETSSGEMTSTSPSSVGFIARISLLLAGATLISRILGLVREMLVANYYGSSGKTDSFFYALIVPELLRTIMISGAVSSVFIPLMTRTQREGNPDEARRLAWMMLVFITLISLIVITLGEIFAPALVSFSQVMSFSTEPLDPETKLLTTELIRIFLPVILFVSLWGLMGGILNTFDNFSIPGLAPLIWNGTIILLLLIWGKYGDVHHIAWAFVIGHFLQAVFHIPWLLKLGIRPSKVDFSHPSLMEFLKLAPAALLAYAAAAVNAFVGQGIALNLSESAASSLAYAFRIQQLPMAIFGVSVATAIFPTLSRYSASGDIKEVVRTLARGIRMIGLSTLPAVVFFLVMPTEVIKLVLERGAFTSENTRDVAAALYWYSWAIMPLSILLITARTFFSTKDTRTPAVLGLISIGINYLLALSLSKLMGFEGIAIATSSVAWVLLILSVLILHFRFRKDESLFTAIGISGTVKLIIAAIAQAFVLYGIKNIIKTPDTSLSLLLYIILALVAGIIVYYLVLKLLQSEDLTSTMRNIIRKS